MPEDHVAVRKVKELKSAAKAWVQSLFKRPLDEREEVVVMVFPPHAAPPESVRRAAGERMDRVLDKAAESMKDVADADFDAAVDEAMDHVRRRDS